MKLYAGIDLHSNNNYLGIISEDKRKIFSQRLPNDKKVILQSLLPYQEQIAGVVLESTYNWYWLVDSLMEAGYPVHLANPAAIQQYKGLKHLDDKHDSFWLATMLSLGILPEGYIYPKASRGLRDILRQRSRLVQKRTSFKNSLDQQCSNQNGFGLSNGLLDKMKGDEVVDHFKDETWRLNAETGVLSLRFLADQIRKIENHVLEKMDEKASYENLRTVPGIGKILALTIALETGPLERFKSAGDYASYCRCVPSAYWSNEKKKGKGNTKNGNRYLAWAYGEAASFCVRFSPEAKAYYQRKVAKSNQPKAYRAIANKLSKACYYMMKGGFVFDAKKLFGKSGK